MMVNLKKERKVVKGKFYSKVEVFSKDFGMGIMQTNKEYLVTRMEINTKGNLFRAENPVLEDISLKMVVFLREI
jgi:hypothetical protein